MKAMYLLMPLKKTILVTIFSCMMFPVLLYGQSKQKATGCIPEKLPSTLKLSEKQPVKYQVTTDYYNKDILGNFFSKTEVTGLYTRGLANGKVQWNNVRIANESQKDKAFTEGTRQDYMEHLQYATATIATDTSIFNGFPAENMYSKTLVWDMEAFESFAWQHFDSLQLNIPYHARIYDTSISLAGAGNFIHKDVKITWTGISRMNAKPCVLIQFEAMDNLINIKTGTLSAKGRSHYWGNIWVALNDKQIEQASMNEDVIMQINFSGNDQLINTTRTIKVEKIKSK